MYEYRPYGGLVTSEGNMAQENKFRFSSEYMDDELGLIYYNYRHLNPRDGRWISRDPIMEQGGWNLFAFVNNNGIINFDYLGLKKMCHLQFWALAMSCIKRFLNRRRLGC
ncbi:MAG: RHS repeat domain-containing protein [Akkermansia muciniphila]